MISNETARTSATGTNTAGQEVPFSFPVSDSSEIIVVKRLTADGTETTLAETTDYTVDVNGDSGGTVTLVSAIAATYTIWVYRDTARTQTLDLEHGGTFSAENIEDALDKGVKVSNDLADQLGRCLMIPVTDSASLDMTLPNSVDRASNYLAFDADGEPTVVASVAPTTATISSWAETLIDDASQAAAQTTLGLVIGTTVQAYDADLTTLGGLAKTDSNFIVGNGTAWVVESGSTARTSMGCPAATDTPLISQIVCVNDAIVCNNDEIVVDS